MFENLTKLLFLMEPRGYKSNPFGKHYMSHRCLLAVILALHSLGIMCESNSSVLSGDDLLLIYGDRISAVRNAQKDLIQLPRVLLWSVLAQQRRHITKVHDDLYQELVLADTSLRDLHASFDLKRLELQSLLNICILTDSQGSQPDMQNEQCQGKESEIQQRISDLQNKKLEILGAEEKIMQTRHDIAIRQQSIKRATFYYERYRDLIFFDNDRNQEEMLHELHSSMVYIVDRTNDLTSDLYWNRKQLLSHVCNVSVVQNVTHTVRECPLEILEDIVQLRNLQWMYHRHRYISHLLDLSQSIVHSLRVMIEATINTISATVPETWVQDFVQSYSRDIPTSLFEVKPNAEYATAAQSELQEYILIYLDTLRCEIVMSRDDSSVSEYGTYIGVDVLNVWKKNREKYSYWHRIRREELKENIAFRQVSLGLLNGDTLIEPTTLTYRLQKRVKHLYKWLTVLNQELSNDLYLKAAVNDVHHFSISSLLKSISTHKYNMQRDEFLTNTLGTINTMYDGVYKPMQATALLSVMHQSQNTFYECLIGNRHVLPSSQQKPSKECLPLAEEVIGYELVLQLALIEHAKPVVADDLAISIIEYYKERKDLLDQLEHRNRLYFMISGRMSQLDTVQVGTTLSEETMEVLWRQHVVLAVQNSALDLGIGIEVAHKVADSSALCADPPQVIFKLRHLSNRLRAEAKVLRNGRRAVEAVLENLAWHRHNVIKKIPDYINESSGVKSGKVQINIGKHDYNTACMTLRKALTDRYLIEKTDAERTSLDLLIKDASEAQEKACIKLTQKILELKSKENPDKVELPDYSYVMQAALIELDARISEWMIFVKMTDMSNRSDFERAALERLEYAHILDLLVQHHIAAQKVVDVPGHAREPMQDAVRMICNRAKPSNVEERNLYGLESDIRNCPPDALNTLKQLRITEYRKDRAELISIAAKFSSEERQNLIVYIIQLMKQSGNPYQWTTPDELSTQIRHWSDLSSKATQAKVTPEIESEIQEQLRHLAIDQQELDTLISFDDGELFYGSTPDTLKDLQIILFDLQQLESAISDVYRIYFQDAVSTLNMRILNFRGELGLLYDPVLKYDNLTALLRQQLKDHHRVHALLGKVWKINRLLLDKKSVSAGEDAVLAALTSMKQVASRQSLLQHMDAIAPKLDQSDNSLGEDPNLSGAIGKVFLKGMKNADVYKKIPNAHDLTYKSYVACLDSVERARRDQGLALQNTEDCLILRKSHEGLYEWMLDIADVISEILIPLYEDAIEKTEFLNLKRMVISEVNHEKLLVRYLHSSMDYRPTLHVRDITSIHLGHLVQQLASRLHNLNEHLCLHGKPAKAVEFRRRVFIRTTGIEEHLAVFTDTKEHIRDMSMRVVPKIDQKILHTTGSPNQPAVSSRMSSVGIAACIMFPLSLIVVCLVGYYVVRLQATVVRKRQHEPLMNDMSWMNQDHDSTVDAFYYPHAQ